MNLALFDFDGTITDIDTFTPFIRFAVGRKRLLVGMIVLSPYIIGYKLGLLPAGKVREVVAGFGFRGREITDLERLGEKYTDQVLSNHIRPEAWRQIRWHQSRGDKIVVVSASLDLYLQPWCEQHKLDLICSQLEVDSGVCTGKYVYGDCCGKEKVRRITDTYDIAGYYTIFAYGDTDEDRQMLDLADIKYYRWQQIK